ncbi:hypothetical protein N9383_03090, partial [Granulosicoccus sp.]|nr:hypothetical protein [Granulosicoccus sp.]
MGEIAPRNYGIRFGVGKIETLAKHKPLTRAQVDAFLDDLLVDADDEEMQLTAIEKEMSDAVQSVAEVEVYVLGELTSLVGVNFDGNVRRALTALCRRDDGREYRISLLDVAIPPQSEIYRYLSAYCRWCGVKPLAVESGVAIKSEPKARQEDLDLTKPVKLIVLRVKERAARCRLPTSSRIITLRARDCWQSVPGQLVTVEPNKHWVHSGHPYLSGKISSWHIDAAKLQLEPLKLYQFGTLEMARSITAEPVLVSDVRGTDENGTQMVFEMQQILPCKDPDDLEYDPIILVNELREIEQFEEARSLLARLLETDLRCLDAYAHLGSMCFDREVHRALQHFELGMRIGQLGINDSFDGLLPWFKLDNRPFLRCLNGYGLCLWRLEKWDEAQMTFQTLLDLDSYDALDAGSSLQLVVE